MKNLERIVYEHKVLNNISNTYKINLKEYFEDYQDDLFLYKYLFAIKGNYKHHKCKIKLGVENDYTDCGN